MWTGGWPNAGDVDIQAHHIAALIALGAVILLLLIDHGFRGLKIDFG